MEPKRAFCVVRSTGMHRFKSLKMEISLHSALLAAALSVIFGAAAAWSPLRLATGGLAVFFPEDAHAPGLAAGTPAAVIKIVIKVAVQ